MSDSRYLDGDPRDVGTCLVDLVPHTRFIVQQLHLIADLIGAGKTVEARALAEDCVLRGQDVLRDTETPEYPRVDAVATKDVFDRKTWVFKRS